MNLRLISINNILINFKKLSNYQKASILFLVAKFLKKKKKKIYKKSVFVNYELMFEINAT